MKYNKHTLIISIPQFTPQTPKHQTTISLSRTKARNHLQIKYMKSSNHHKKFAILYLKMWFHHILHPKILLCSLHYHLSCCKKRYINPNYRTCNLTIPTPISSTSSIHNHSIYTWWWRWHYRFLDYPWVQWRKWI